MKILVVGAGLAGATIAREMAEAGHDIHIIESRDHIAGNAYDYNVNGVLIHKYGPHLFHTKNSKVFKYLSKFTEWVPYKHKVKALLKDGTYVTLPVNKETSEIVGIENIVNTFFRPYSKKMWGVDIEDLDPSIINRVPIRDDDNEYYFPNDKYQALPKKGYTAMVEKMLRHKNIKINLNCNFNKSMEEHFNLVFNSMPIDEYYEFCHGHLPYRSIKFHNQIVWMPYALPCGTINFTHNDSFTRVTEWKRLPNSKVNPGTGEASTVLTYEEPCDYRNNNMQRYYPVKDLAGENQKLYKMYKDIKNDKVVFIGRCGMYQYLDMDQVVNQTLRLVKDYK